MQARRWTVWLASVSVASLILAAPLAQADETADFTVPLPPEAVATFDAPDEPAPFNLALPEAPAVEVTFDAPAATPPAIVAVPLATPPAAATPSLGTPPVIAAPVLAAPAPSAPPPAIAQVPAPQPAVADGTLTREALQEAAAAFAKAELPTARTGAQVANLRKEREALLAFYAARDFQPLWIEGKGYTQAAQAALATIKRAADDGLDLSAYALPAPKGAAANLAEAELRLAEAIAAYGRQASGSRVDPGRLSSLITSRPNVADSAQVLSSVAAAVDPAAILQAYNPPHRAYAALRAKLIELHTEAKPADPVAIPPGATLRAGMHDARVPLIRARFALAEAQGDNATLYDETVAGVIAEFQRANSLPATGVLTPRTIAALSGGQSTRLENEILANMERWRWMARDLGESRIEVNIPDYRVQVFKQGALVHEARVVVGKPDTPTPVFSHVMQFLIVNPYWNVPQSIIKNEMMPKLAADPNYLHRLGYEVVQRNGYLTVRQPPGERNALGRIKFMFPNDHAVYLHDTPSRALFGAERRAFSHGCVRVDQPMKLAEVVLGRDNGWSEDKVRALIGGPERTIHMKEPLPIHIMYFTASVDEAGKVQLRDDIYGYSRRVKAALGLEGEVYVEAPPRAPAAKGQKRAAPSTVAGPKVAAAEPAKASWFSGIGAGAPATTTAQGR